MKVVAVADIQGCVCCRSSGSSGAHGVGALPPFRLRRARRSRQGVTRRHWLRDESLEDTENLPAPDVIAREILDDLEAALAEFSAVADSLT
jgi:hypothetical protein